MPEEPPISPSDDLDLLIAELNASPSSTPSESGAATVRGSEDVLIGRWLASVREVDGSDLMLVAGCSPMIRTAGRLIPADPTVLDSDDIVNSVRPLVASHRWTQYQSGQSIDVAFRRPGLGRFRMNLHRERGRAAAAIRALPLRIPDIAALRFSHDISLLSRLPRGLVLIGGPTGSGKTTTLAAMIALINSRDARHIVTVEDPIEYEHSHSRSIIEQVEIGADAPDFPTALRSALRQAPDVIVVGEMRDPETMRIALAAAETGHLVFATIHTTDVAAAVSRIVDAFPAERQNAVRQELAMSLAAVLTQMLLPAIDGSMFPVAELLIASYGARQHIRKNALQHLNQEITITRKQGSFTLEESLARSIERKFLTTEQARLRAVHPDELDSLLKR